MVTYLLLLTVVLTLGFNWPLMAVGLGSISPLWMGTFRILGALAIMTSVGVITGQLHLPRRRDLPVVWSVGIFRLFLVTVIVFSALRIVPPGRSSVLAWTASLWTVPLAALFLKERMTLLRWLGLSVGISGIVLLFEPWRFDWTDTMVIGGHALLMASAFTNAATTVHIRRHGWTSSTLEIMPWQLLVAAVPVTALALAVDGIPTIDWTPQLLAIVIYQGLFATAVAVWAQQTVLQRLPAVSTNLTLMAVPVVGLLSSVALVGESLTAAIVGAVVLILAGVGTNILADYRRRSAQIEQRGGIAAPDSGDLPLP
ncbi:MAG TPA: DMT family transporter [Acidimicrobiia bacterium]|nr:DMT family transporter [Acidimicrobiia bacterium]